MNKIHFLKKKIVLPQFVLPWYLNTLQQNLWPPPQSRVHKIKAKVQSPSKLEV